MRRSSNSIVVALTPLALASCAGTGGPATTTLTRVAEAVRVTDNSTSARDCEFIANLTPRSPDPSEADAIRALRNEAGGVGANLVLLVMDERGTISRAEGYLCADE